MVRRKEVRLIPVVWVEVVSSSGVPPAAVSRARGAAGEPGSRPQALGCPEQDAERLFRGRKNAGRHKVKAVIRGWGAYFRSGNAALRFNLRQLRAGEAQGWAHELDPLLMRPIQATPILLVGGALFGVDGDDGRAIAALIVTFTPVATIAALLPAGVARASGQGEFNRSPQSRPPSASRSASSAATCGRSRPSVRPSTPLATPSRTPGPCRPSRTSSATAQASPTSPAHAWPEPASGWCGRSWDCGSRGDGWRRPSWRPRPNLSKLSTTWRRRYTACRTAPDAR
jgi:hypothetical protein